MKSITLIAGFGLSLASALPSVHLPYSAAPNIAPRSGSPLHFNIRAGNATGGGGAIAPGCATGVHMIIARASTEAAGPGVIGGVATMVTKAVPGSDSESVVYPATLTDYANSEGQGVAGMNKLIQAYTQKCPNSKIALMGYSQVNRPIFSLHRILG